MALSSEDQIEVRLLILEEVGKVLNESSGFAEARRSIDRRMQELEADRLDHQDKHEKADEAGKVDPEFGQD